MKSLAAAVLLTALAVPGVARADQPCSASLDAVRLANPLTHVAHKLAVGDPITIVAIGSSSTAGAGASAPAFSYPSRLEAELSALFPRQKFTVLNRGVNGEEVPDMLKRFDEAIVDQRPDLVVWQLGTNSVMRDKPVDARGEAIHEGIEIIKSVGADVVLMDPQYAPKVIVKADIEPMLNLLSVTAKSEHVNLFARFNLMKRWHNVEKKTFEDFVTADGLHMNDWGYGCIAKAMAGAIAEAATRPVASASAVARPDVAQ
ncbi:MAG: SGNH/GDSL hydrolase family protein [Pseudolabrys sp.]|nr:SGNH/GDSL hydrolase family protein [Pseudolabrys sp.]